MIARQYNPAAVEFHKIWIDQCDAGCAIRERFGLEKALGYLVGEKLLHFLRAAETCTSLAAEIRKLVVEVKNTFL